MSIQLVKVLTRNQLRKFIKFPYKLYKGCSNWVPPLMGDEFDAFDRKNNGAFEYCDCECYLAYRDSEIVGRVAAIVNFRANEKWNTPVVRFGWLDFINDIDVLKVLLDAVAEYGKSKGCSQMKGPLGFTDMDKEGMLIEGFDKLSPFTCLYNYPYYPELMEKLGFSKDADWTQKIVDIPQEPMEMYRFVDTIKKTYKINTVHCNTTREMADRYAVKLFHVCNETFSQLFQYTPLTDRQIERYVQTYKAILSPDYISIVAKDDGQMVGFAFCVPSLSVAVKKCGGKLFPFGFVNVLHALKHNDTIEALMIGVLPEFQGTGATLLMMEELHRKCIAKGIRKMIMNPQLETNIKVQTLFDNFDYSLYMRRRCYCKPID